MNLNDLIIIYLACGAPFAVYYFLQNRNFQETKILWLKTLFRFVFWIPFAFRLVARRHLFTNLYSNEFDRKSNSDAKKEAEIFSIQKQFENNLRDNHPKLSIFEFRETFERYTGLTLELQNGSEEIAAREKEIFRVTNHQNKKLAEICLHRRNRQRLIFHQNLARRDFFEVLGQLTKTTVEKQSLYEKAFKLVSLLNDSEAQKTLEELNKQSLQTQEKTNVRNLEKELWNSEKPQPTPASQISANMQALTATANLSPKD